MSIDSGMSGNLFSGHYFTMNQNHLNGVLNKVDMDFKHLEANKHNYILNLYPKYINQTSQSENKSEL